VTNHESPEAKVVNKDILAACYKYLSAPILDPCPTVPADVTIIFGRKSQELIETAARVAPQSKLVIASGNVGKDSGDLPSTNTPEAAYIINALLEKMIISRDRTIAEISARNGRENVENCLRAIRERMHRNSVDKLYLVMHSTQAKRLTETFRFLARQSDFAIKTLACIPSGYQPNYDNPYDQYEITGEMVRIKDFSTAPPSPILTFPTDINQGHLAYATELFAQLETRFRDMGIINPSTADNTDHYHSPHYANAVRIFRGDETKP
jgi:hypothetical protein